MLYLLTMGRTISQETKSAKINIRVKESLKKSILELKENGPYQDLDFQDVIMILVRIGLNIETEVIKYRDDLAQEAINKQGGLEIASKE